MRRRVAPIAAAASLLAGGCGAGEEPVPSACAAGAQVIATALRSAPGPVALPGGTRLSHCVARATSDADLQSFGILLIDVAEQLADTARTDPASALRLGYLIGAARRGATNGNGVQLELVRRLESSARRAGGGPEILRGQRAGEARG